MIAEIHAAILQTLTSYFSSGTEFSQANL